jgi:hypothetical protein
MIIIEERINTIKEIRKRLVDGGLEEDLILLQYAIKQNFFLLIWG